jgi:hypothetical protein
MARRIEVEIVGDSRSLERSFDRSSRSARKFNQDLSRSSRTGTASFVALGRAGSRVGAGFAAIGGVGVGLGLKSSISAASDLSEQMSKTGVVFDESAQQIKDWSETTADAFGISQRQALATASSFGALFAPLGIVGPEAAKQAQALTELGADLASFYNTDVQAALDAIRSGIVGEAEPLRQYGALLSETRVQQQAMAETGKRNASALTAQEKALARISLIFQDTAQAQGDFARTSEGLANQTRIFKANIDELATTLGQVLVPGINTALGAFNNLLGALKQRPEIGIRPGERLETTLVPDLAKQIQQMRKAGRTGAEIIATLRRRLGGRGPRVDELIAEAFQFVTGVNPKLRARIKKSAEAIAKAANEEIVKAARRGPTAEQRNTWFDAMISRQLDRVQDLSLRRQLARLRTIAQEIRARLAVTRDTTRRLTLEDRLLDVLRQQRSVQEQIGDQVRAANEALKDRAEAIKSAVLDRLQRRQTDILNKRALADAREQLRIARQIGGPKGIQEATRALQDVRFDILRARIEAAPATLTAGGRFQLGNVITINIHGITDPEAVARRVDAILRRRRRRTTTQQRGPVAAH